MDRKVAQSNLFGDSLLECSRDCFDMSGSKQTLEMADSWGFRYRRNQLLLCYIS